MPQAKNLNKSGFTLLEVIIVTIILGVLISLALPALYKSIELSRRAEAWVAIGAIREAMERCYLKSQGTYWGCNLNYNLSRNNTLDINDPTDSVGSHFSYIAGPDVFGAQFHEAYSVYALRNQRNNSNYITGETSAALAIAIMAEGTSSPVFPNLSLGKASCGEYSGLYDANFTCPAMPAMFQ